MRLNEGDLSLLGLLSISYMKWLKQLLFLPGGWKSEIVVSAQMGSESS